MFNSQFSIPSTWCPVRDQLYQPQKVVWMIRQFIYGQTEFRHLKTKNEQDFSNRSWNQIIHIPSCPMGKWWQKEHSFLETAWSLEPAKTQYIVHRFSFILNSRTHWTDIFIRISFGFHVLFYVVPIPISKKSSLEEYKSKSK